MHLAVQHTQMFFSEPHQTTYLMKHISNILHRQSEILCQNNKIIHQHSSHLFEAHLFIYSIKKFSMVNVLKFRTPKKKRTVTLNLFSLLTIEAKESNNFAEKEAIKRQFNCLPLQNWLLPFNCLPMKNWLLPSQNFWYFPFRNLDFTVCTDSKNIKPYYFIISSLTIIKRNQMRNFKHTFLALIKHCRLQLDYKIVKLWYAEFIC